MYPRSRPLLRSAAVAGVALATLGGAVATAGVVPAGASDQYAEHVVVRPDGVTVRTDATMMSGRAYTLSVEGTYRFGSQHADAECSTSTLDPLWRRGGEGLDLLVDGQDVEWEPVERDLLACNSRTHRYIYSVRTATDRQLEFVIDLPRGSEASGALTVVIEGPGRADADSAGPETTTEQPEDQASGPRSQPDPEPQAQPESAPSEPERRYPEPSPPTPRHAPEPSADGPAPTGPRRAVGAGGSGGSAAPAPTESICQGSCRQLTTDELLDVLAPGVRERRPAGGQEGDQHEQPVRTITLASEPADVAAPTERISWIAVVAALTVAAALYRSGPLRNGVLRVVRSETRTIWEILTGDRRRHALAHRETGVARRRSASSLRVGSESKGRRSTLWH